MTEALPTADKDHSLKAFVAASSCSDQTNTEPKEAQGYPLCLLKLNSVAISQERNAHYAEREQSTHTHDSCIYGQPLHA
jgi:hypothetical protein